MDQAAKNPRFSVLIPAYNRADLVGLTVDSVLAQTFRDFEIVAVDDGSTDRTADVLASYDARIKLLKQVNRGAEAARNAGASIATGQYLVLLDSDDLLYPDALANYDRIIRQLDGPPVILGAMSYFKHGTEPPPNALPGGPLKVVKFRDFISKDRGTGISCSCIVANRTVALAAGALHREPLAFPFEGNDIMLLLGTCSPCIQMVSPFTVAYRNHSSNVSSQLAYLLESALKLTRNEKLGHYPGGAARRFERRAYIGGVCWRYISKGLKRGMLATSLRALIWLFPMVAAGALNIFMRRFREKSPVISLHN